MVLLCFNEIRSTALDFRLLDEALFTKNGYSTGSFAKGGFKVGDTWATMHLLIMFRIPFVIIVFLGLGRERLLPLARNTHRSLLQAPAYLAYTSTVSLSLLDTNRVPNHYRLQSSRITKPPNGTAFDSSTPPNGSRKAIIMRRGKKQNPGDLAHPPPCLLYTSPSPRD